MVSRRRERLPCCGPAGRSAQQGPFGTPRDPTGKARSCRAHAAQRRPPRPTAGQPAWAPRASAALEAAPRDAPPRRPPHRDARSMATCVPSRPCGRREREGSGLCALALWGPRARHSGHTAHVPLRDGPLLVAMATAASPSVDPDAPPAPGPPSGVCPIASRTSMASPLAACPTDTVTQDRTRGLRGSCATAGQRQVPHPLSLGRHLPPTWGVRTGPHPHRLTERSAWGAGAGGTGRWGVAAWGRLRRALPGPGTGWRGDVGNTGGQHVRPGRQTVARTTAGAAGHAEQRPGPLGHQAPPTRQPRELRRGKRTSATMFVRRHGQSE